MNVRIFMSQRPTFRRAVYGPLGTSSRTWGRGFRPEIGQNRAGRRVHSAMVGGSPKDRKGPVDLLGQNDPGKLVREGEAGEGQHGRRPVAKLRVEPLRSSDAEGDRRRGPQRPVQPPRELLRAESPPGAIACR